MTTRRELLQLAACAAVPASMAALQPAAAATPAALHAVIIESSQASARAFGQRLSARGAAVLAIRDGDVTAAWLASIRPAWRNGPATVAGLTTPSALFCFEQLAWSHGLRVVFHAEHIFPAGAAVEHALQRADRNTAIAAASLRQAGAGWPLLLADAIAARRPVLRGSRPGPSIAALAPALPQGAQLLTSWIIAAA